jgi:hypothetical protein
VLQRTEVTAHGPTGVHVLCRVERDHNPEVEAVITRNHRAMVAHATAQPVNHNRVSAAGDQ